MAPTEPSSHRERVYWTAEEDQLLKELVEIHGSKRGKDSKWPIVAAALEGRNIKDCRKRFFHSLAPDLKKGRWSKEEDRLLLEGLEKLGPVWFQIAKMIPGRKDDQCAKRWKEVLDPSLSKGLPWSKDEDTLLLSLYESTGPRWQLIARSIPGRTGLCCRNRWRKFKGDELVASELAAMEEKQKKNVGGNAGGTRTLPDGGRGRRSNSSTEEGSAGSSTGTGTKAGEKKRKRTVKEDGASPVDSRRPPQPASSSLSSLQQQIHDQSQQQQLLLQQQQHQQQQSMDHQFQPSSNGQFNFFESLNHDDNSPHSSGSSEYSQPLQTFSHHGEALVPPFGLSLFSPNSHLQNEQSVQSPLQHSPHHHESPMGGINSIGHQPMNEAGGMLYQSGGGGGGGVEVPRARTLSVDPQNASASRVEVVQQRGLPAFDNQLDRFAHLLPPDHHLTGPKSQPSNASSMSGSSIYTPSMSGTSPSTTLDSLATPASESNQGSGQGLAQTPQVSSEPVVLAHHDDSSWMASFLGSLHHPSASLPPSALNSPIFTGAFEAGLFSAPPSPTRHLYQHLLPPPPLNLDALSPLSEEPASTPSSSSYRQPSTPASQLPNGNQQQQQQQQQTSAKSYLPPPQSTVHLSNANHFLSTSSTAERNLQQHQLHQQQQQQLQIQLQQQQLQVQQQAQQQQHQQQLQQQQQQAQGRHPSSNSSSVVARAQYVPQSSPPPPPRNMRNDAFPLPTTATSGTTPSTPHSIYPQPQTVLPYMTWDPRPIEEQTPQAPMVLVPAVVLAGLLERAGMQSHRS